MKQKKSLIEESFVCLGSELVRLHVAWPHFFSAIVGPAPTPPEPVKTE